MLDAKTLKKIERVVDDYCGGIGFCCDVNVALGFMERA